MALDTNELQKPFQKLRKNLKRFPRNAGVDQVHKLRTHSRRVESVIAARTDDPNRRERRLLKLIAAVRKRAGKVRDMDVLTSFADSLPMLEGEEECKTLLLEDLGATRKRHARKLFRKTRSTGGRLRRKLKRSESRLAQSLQPEAEASAAGRRAASEALDISAQLAEIERLDRRNLHEYRLTVKHLRNILQFANEHQADQELIEDLKETKDAIGEWHDWEMLADIAAKVTSGHSRCKLMSRIRQIVREHYEKAQKSGLELQARHFKPVMRGKKADRSQAMNRDALSAAASLVA